MGDTVSNRDYAHRVVEPEISIESNSFPILPKGVRTAR